MKSMTAEEKIIDGLKRFDPDSRPMPLPNCIRPIHGVSEALQAELDAWEDASDEIDIDY